jgi:hypothetical protein
MVAGKIKKGVDVAKKVKRIKKLQEKKFKESLNPPGFPKLHKDANIKAQIQRKKNIKLLKEREAAEKARIKKLTPKQRRDELLAPSKGSGELGSTLGRGNPGGIGGQVYTSPSRYKLDTEYAKGGSVRKQRRLAKRGWGATKRK